MGLNSTAVAIQPNVSCTCNCKRSLFQSMEISKYSSCRCRGAAAASRGRVRARAAPRAGKFAGGPPAAPGPFAAMRLLGVTVPPSPRASSARPSVAVAVSGAGGRSPSALSADPLAPPRRRPVKSQLFPGSAPSSPASRPFPRGSAPAVLRPPRAFPCRGGDAGGPRPPSSSGGLH